MTLKEVIYVSESAVFQTIFLLFVSSVEDGTNEIVCFLPFYDIVQHLSIIEPYKISKRQVCTFAMNSILILKSGLKEALFLFIFNLSTINQ